MTALPLSMIRIIFVRHEQSNTKTKQQNKSQKKQQHSQSSSQTQTTTTDKPNTKQPSQKAMAQALS